VNNHGVIAGYDDGRAMLWLPTRWGGRTRALTVSGIQAETASAQ
jgi:hypothetical protein